MRTCPCGSRFRARTSGKYCSEPCRRTARRAQASSAARARWLADPAKEKARKRRYAYGLSAEGFGAMLGAQGGRCLLCLREFSGERTAWPHVDHDHETGRIRGLLCPSCNMGIGQLQDSPALLRRAADYLEAEL